MKKKVSETKKAIAALRKEKLEEYADKYGDNIPVCTFDLERDICDIDDVDVYDVRGKAYYIYIG